MYGAVRRCAMRCSVVRRGAGWVFCVWHGAAGSLRSCHACQAPIMPHRPTTAQPQPMDSQANHSP
eukprot:363737-Chlamydomonas_euryale.AAC.3